MGGPVSRAIRTRETAAMGLRTRQLNQFYDGMKELKKTLPDQIDGFNTLLKAELNNGCLDLKTKELISVAIACHARCEYCIVYHVYAAIKAGAGAEEILEAGMVSVVFGGGPAMSYVATILQDCIKEFSECE